MPVLNTDKIPKNAVGLKLYRIDSRDRLHACELVIFEKGYAAVDTTLRRAAISGRVDVGGNIKDHFADIYVDEHTCHETVALDAKSYGALKDHWMRCKVESSDS